MKFSTIAWHNIRNTIGDYTAYLSSMAFSVMIYFLFSALYYNKQFNEMMQNSLGLLIGFEVSGIIVIIFSVVFLWYSTVIFLQKRKQEIGIYTLLGMKKREIGIILFSESMILGFIALIGGILTGILFQKYFTMLLISFMRTTAHIRFEFSLTAFYKTFINFGVLFVLAGIYSFTSVYRYKLIELFNAGKSIEKVKRSNWKNATGLILTILTLGGGYFLAEFLLKTIGHINEYSLLSILLLTVLGSFFLFGSFLFSILAILKKSAFYRGSISNLPAWGQLLFRVKKNSRMLGMVAVLNAICLTALCFVFVSLEMGSNSRNSMSPFSFSFKTDSEVEAKEVYNELKQLDKNLLYSYTEVLNFPISLEGFGYVDGIISETDYRQILKIQGFKDEVTMPENSALIISAKQYPMRKTKLNGFEGKTIPLKSRYEKSEGNLFISEILYNKIPYNRITLVVKDELKERLDNEFVQAYKSSFAVFMTDDISNSEEVSNLFLSLVDDEKSPISLYLQSSHYFKTYGLFVFLGVFIGIMFFLSTCSLIFFSQLMEARESKERFKILENIGYSIKSLKRIISHQSVIVFFAPLILGILHTHFALRMMEQMEQRGYRKLFFIISGSYSILYLLYFLLNNRMYGRIVLKKRKEI